METRFQIPKIRLREAHCHLPSLGRSLSQLDVAQVASKEELLGRLAESAQKLPSDAWLIAIGMRVEAWEKPQWPSRIELDAISAGHPCIVRGFDFHSLVANSAALAAAKVSESTSDPAAGMYRRDDDGKLSGVCLEAAANHVWSAVPEPSEIERENHIRAGLKHLAAFGFTEIDDLLSPPWLGAMLAKMSDSGELHIKVRLFPPVAELGESVKHAKKWGRENVNLAGGKLFADGSLNARTAWMLEPYADGHKGQECGLPNWSADQLVDAVKECERFDLPLATHAIGDRAVREVLNAIERGSTKSSIRHRIEHCEVMSSEDVPRFAKMGVIASVQPCHLLYDIEVLRRAAPDRLGRVLPLRKLIDSGCRPGELLIFGSDVPIVPADPRDSIQAAVFRRRIGMQESDAIGMDQAISEAEAWRCFAT